MLKGSLVAIVTPFDVDGKVNVSKLDELIEYQIKSQTDGIVLFGTTGEAATITLDEKIDVLKHVVSLINKRVPLIVGASSNCTLDACRAAEIFSNLGADYILVTNPYYNKCNKIGLIKHFEEIALASCAPIILYNVPSRTGMSIPLEVIKEVHTNKNIIGIKEASGDISYAIGISKYLNDEFLMFSGNDDVIVPYMAIGAKGVISVLANIAPKVCHDLCDACLNGDFKKGLEYNVGLAEVIKALFIETNPIPVKASLNYLGFNVGGYHLPLCEMDKENEKKLFNTLDLYKEMIY